VRIAQIDVTVFGLPFALVYLFSVWALLVIGAAFLARPLRDSEKPATPTGNDEAQG